MDLKSIRWQLPLSYAGIALLAAVVLGAAMLWMLNGYYSNLEHDYLESSATSIQTALRPLALDQFPADLLQAQVQSFALFSSYRVRLYGKDNQLLADSGDSPAGTGSVSFFSLPVQSLTESGSRPATNLIIVNGALAEGTDLKIPGKEVLYYQQSFSNEQGGAQSAPSTSSAPGDQVFLARGSDTPVVGQVMVMSRVSAFGAIDPSGGIDPTRRSSTQLELPILDAEGRNNGRLVLSNGPAFGSKIVDSAAQAWAIAGAIAVLLAAAAGWIASRRVSRPLLALAHTAQGMASGNLATRAGIDSLPAREFVLVASSFNEMADRIEDTIATLRRFAGDAAHQLKTPLTALRTNLELLQDEPEPARQAAFMERAQFQVKHLDSLMTGLLDLSRLEAGGGQEAETLVDLAALVRRLGEVYASRAEQAGLSFELRSGAGPTLVTGRSSQLEQAVGNLLDNAIKFTPEGGAVCLGLDAAGTRVQLWVEDSGIGIPLDDLPQLFNRFHRGRNAMGYPGSGLGLAIVHAIVQVHHAELKAVNLSPAGARFSILFP